ncbi:hypothetical protein B0H16DRAFT_696315 [Mycena metata]|uniref:CRIB domain-containing protein n=1 Tax=Mycena metata TaxID=1033252 RepID=A0AAD7NEC7_9AGAR|nr:hypothetical protein B0H16DRAFT_696315 [Mycena metata]
MEVKGGGKQSRFSTLKVFKFGKNATPAPPPLPPKDPGYLAARNRSLASLSPDSLPASPLSGDQYAASSSSAVSLALPLQKQRSGLFKSRSKRKPASPTSPPNDDEDENISMPWNFQHNVHVDEGFTGMPPSWNTSLQEAGFSEDEIAAIQQRRMPVPPALVKPVPRSTSLPKNQQQQIESRSTPEPAPAPSSTYSSPKLGYRAPSPKQSYRPPSPKSPPPVYNYEQPLPLNIPRGKPSAAYTGQQSHSRAGSQQSSSSSHSNSYSSHSHSHSHSEDEEDRQDSRSHSSPRLASPASETQRQEPHPRPRAPRRHRDRQHLVRGRAIRHTLVRQRLADRAQPRQRAQRRFHHPPRPHPAPRTSASPPPPRARSSPSPARAASAAAAPRSRTRCSTRWATVTVTPNATTWRMRSSRRRRRTTGSRRPRRWATGGRRRRGAAAGAGAAGATAGSRTTTSGTTRSLGSCAVPLRPPWCRRRVRGVGVGVGARARGWGARLGVRGRGMRRMGSGWAWRVGGATGTATRRCWGCRRARGWCGM